MVRPVVLRLDDAEVRAEPFREVERVLDVVGRRDAARVVRPVFERLDFDALFRDVDVSSYDRWSWIRPLLPLMVSWLGACRLAWRLPVATAVSLRLCVLSVLLPDETAHPPSRVGATESLLRAGTVRHLPPVPDEIRYRSAYLVS